MGAESKKGNIDFKKMHARTQEIGRDLSTNSPVYKEMQAKTQEIGENIADLVYQRELESFKKGEKPERMSQREIDDLLAKIKNNLASLGQ